MEIEEHVPLSSLTTFRTGGPARFLVSAHDEADLADATAFAHERRLPLIPLGSGSNLCAPDEGVKAVFVRFLADSISVQSDAKGVSLAADAGLSWDALAARATREGWWGIENLSGIPGTVGASAVQNIGAYGAAAGQHIASVDAFDTKEHTMKTFTAAECLFGYRTSIFKKEPDRYFVLRVTFLLSRNPQPNLSYRDLKNRFEDAAQPGLQDIRDAILETRKGKFPPLSEYGTAGSFFLNPIVTDAERSALAAEYPEIPLFAMPEGGVKVPLAWILDRVLKIKGMREGKAFVWEKQPLVLATESGARSADVYALAGKIARLAKEKTNIDLVPEVRIKF
jgi:UDP-N-acetylmuramate dehydrogenase